MSGTATYHRAVFRRAALLTALLMAIPIPAWAHGIGGRSDLPLPLEVYLVAGAVSGLRPAVYHYDPRRHRLVLRQEGDARTRLAQAALQQGWVAEAPAVIVLAAVPARTARKYGERATRYVHMEVGHAAQNVYLQAAALGLGTTVVGAFHDTAVTRALGLPAETKPMALLPVGRPR